MKSQMSAGKIFTQEFWDKRYDGHHPQAVPQPK